MSPVRSCMSNAHHPSHERQALRLPIFRKSGFGIPAAARISHLWPRSASVLNAVSVVLYEVVVTALM